MTVASTTIRASYAGDGSTTAFSTGFYFIDNADLRVSVVVDATGVETVKTLTTHYTVSGAGGPGAGTVTFLTAPAPGETVLIILDPSRLQSLDFSDNPRYSPTAVEKQLDRRAHVAMRLSDRVDRALRTPDSEAEIGPLPIAGTRANKIISFDENGDVALVTRNGEVADDEIGTAQLADDAVTSEKIADGSVTNAKLSDMAEATFKGRASGAGTGAPQNLTAAQVLTILGIGTGTGGNYATVSEAIASTSIAAEPDLIIKGRRWSYTASTPGHSAYFTNTNSSRKYELNVDAITEDIIADSEIFNGDRDAAALSGYRTNTPLNMSDGYATLVLNPITEDATNTDVGRMAVVNAITEYIGDCICTGGSYIEWTIPSVGEIAVDGGQIVWGDLDIPAPTNPLIINAPAPDTNIISAISFAGSKTSRVVYCYVSSGGTGYSSSFSVTATGGGGSGFAGTAYAVGGVIQAIVVTNGGSGWTSAPTLNLSAGGGSGAAAYAEINKDIVSVTVTLTSALPSYMAVGMPFGLRDVDGNNDADWLQGAGIVSAFNTGAKTITFDYSIPSATLPTSPTTITTTGTKSRVYFFPTWFTVKGGYGGGATGKEAFINATRNGHIRLYNLACAWSASSQTQANKYNPSGAHVGGLNGSIHFYESCCFVGFPNFQVRYFQGDGFSTLLFLGGSTTGFSGMRMQGGGKGQFGYVYAGGFRAGTAALQALDGNYMEISVLTVGAASTGVDCTGQDVNLANGKIAGCTVGMSCSKGGNLNVGSSSVTIKRCNVGQQFSTGGKIIGDPTFTSSISLDCLVPVNSAYQGGGWLSNAASEITRYYFTSAIFHGYGAGTPEGAVAASVGSIWSRSDGGASTTLYVKTSGTGNTGWTAK